MGQALYSGAGYQLSDGLSTGEIDISKNNIIDASTGYSESISLHGASNIRFTFDSIAGSTGSILVKYSPDKAFAEGVSTEATIAVSASEDGANFVDVGPFNSFARIYNTTNNVLKAYFQAWVGD